MKTLAYIVMAYMPNGSVKVKELFAEDLYRGEVGDAAKALKAQVALMHEANVIVGLNIETGQAVTLKNRWGPTGRQFAATKPTVSSGAVKLLQALEASGYKAAPAKLMDTVLQIEELGSTQNCKCDIKDLMSTGHISGCPERKK